MATAHISQWHVARYAKADDVAPSMSYAAVTVIKTAGVIRCAYAPSYVSVTSRSVIVTTSWRLEISQQSQQRNAKPVSKTTAKPTSIAARGETN